MSAPCSSPGVDISQKFPRSQCFRQFSTAPALTNWNLDDESRKAFSHMQPACNQRAIIILLANRSLAFKLGKLRGQRDAVFAPHLLSVRNASIVCSYCVGCNAPYLNRRAIEPSLQVGQNGMMACSGLHCQLDLASLPATLEHSGGTASLLQSPRYEEPRRASTRVEEGAT